jgi:hypothetical protein
MLASTQSRRQPHCYRRLSNIEIGQPENGWKGICVYHEANGNSIHCPIGALGRRYLHLRHHGAPAKTFLLAYFNEARQRFDIANQDISAALKLAATFLDYPTTKGIPINHIDTCSEAVEQMRYRWPDIPTPRYKKWVGSTGPRSKNTSKKNLQVSRRECLAA